MLSYKDLLATVVSHELTRPHFKQVTFVELMDIPLLGPQNNGPSVVFCTMTGTSSVF